MGLGADSLAPDRGIAIMTGQKLRYSRPFE